MPEGWDYVRKNKNRYLLEIEERAKAVHFHDAKCIKPCFNEMQTSVVNTSESECMTNCIAKGHETRALFEYLATKDKYKN